MPTENKIDINTIAVVNQAVTESDNLETMCSHLAQLLTATLEIKGCAVFLLNPDSQELELLSSFGLSIAYLNKGPILSRKSLADAVRGNPVIIEDVSRSKKLQYPEHAAAEGIGAIVAMPVKYRKHVIGALRLYDHGPWNLSAKDMTFIHCLADTLGLAMTCARLANALQTVKEPANSVHALWL